MGNRLIKESICSSEKIAGLTDFEFRLWIGLITQADDAGRGDARAAIIKGRVFPLRDRTTVKDIEASLHALAAKGCVTLYTVDGRPYFWFPSWAEHQRIRNCQPKYPDPENSDELRQSAAICRNLPQSAANCGELRQSAASCGLNTIQYESNTNTNSNTNPTKKTGASTRREPPTLEEVVAYCKERNSSVDPYKFFEYFDAGKWIDAKGQPVLSWKQKLLTWEKFGGDISAGVNAKRAEKGLPPTVVNEGGASEDEMEEMRAYLQHLKGSE